jgi:hypothetical protein
VYNHTSSADLFIPMDFGCDGDSTSDAFPFFSAVPMSFDLGPASTASVEWHWDVYAVED